MRTTANTLATVLALASSLAFAQPAPTAPTRPTYDPFSPLVYDALGATPKIQLRKAPAAPKAVAEKKAPAEAVPSPSAPQPATVTRAPVTTPTAETTH